MKNKLFPFSVFDTLSSSTLGQYKTKSGAKRKIVKEMVDRGLEKKYFLLRDENGNTVY